MALVNSQDIQRPVTVNDDIEINTYADLEKIIVTDNETHLIITTKFSQSMPGQSPRTYYIDHWIYLFIDTDNNRKTGYFTGYPNEGYEVGIYIANYTYYKTVEVHLWNTDGEFIEQSFHPEWFTSVNGSSITLAIPLDWLNVSIGDRILIQNIVGRTYIYDWLYPSPIVNFTVPYADVNVDGNVSSGEWPSDSLLAVDYDDGVYDPYHQDFNLTKLYIATNNKALYIRMDLGNTTRTYPSTLSHWGYILISLDTDNDGDEDYLLILDKDYVHVTDRSTGKSSSYSIWSNKYNVTWYETSHIELALNLSIIGLNNLVGKNLTILDALYKQHVLIDQLRILYDICRPRYSYGWVWSPRIFYTVGHGGYTAIPIDIWAEIFYISTYGERSIHVGNATFNISFNISSSTFIRILVSAYDNEPAGNASFDGLGYYYALWFCPDDLDYVDWPIVVAINYNGILDGMCFDESSLGVYYYDASRGEYIRCNSTWVDIDRKIVYASLTREEYLAGDDPVIVLSSERIELAEEEKRVGVVGGEIIDLEMPSYNCLIGTTVAILTGITIILILLTRKKHRP